MKARTCPRCHSKATLCWRTVATGDGSDMSTGIYCNHCGAWTRAHKPTTSTSNGEDDIWRRFVEEWGPEEDDDE